MEKDLLEQLKSYIKIENGTDEDNIIQSLYQAAKSLAYGQTGKLFDGSMIGKNLKNEKMELYWLALQLLISHWYENRSMVTTGVVSTEVPFSANLILNHIALSGDFE